MNAVVDMECLGACLGMRQFASIRSMLSRGWSDAGGRQRRERLWVLCVQMGN